MHGLYNVETASAYYHLALVRQHLGRFDAALEDAQTCKAILLKVHSNDTTHPDTTEAIRLVALIVRYTALPCCIVAHVVLLCAYRGWWWWEGIMLWENFVFKESGEMFPWKNLGVSAVH